MTLNRPVYHLTVVWTQPAIVLAWVLYATLAGTWASWVHVFAVACIGAWLLYRAVSITRQHVREQRKERRMIEARVQAAIERRARHVELRSWPRPRPLPTSIPGPGVPRKWPPYC